MNVKSESFVAESISSRNSVSSNVFSLESLELESVENEVKNSLDNASEDLESLETSGLYNDSEDLSIIESLETLGLDSDSEDLSDIESLEILESLDLDLRDEQLQEQEDGLWLLEDRDVITKEESQLRIIWLLTIVAFFAFFITIGEMIRIGILVIPHVPKIVEPHITQENLLRYKIVCIHNRYLSNFSLRTFPIAHLAIIFQDGSVNDLSLQEKVSPSKGWILKLPKKHQYHGYSDEKGILYFIDGELKSPITKYHKTINQQGHSTISDKSRQSLYVKNMVFQCSVSVGANFWLFGDTAMDSFSNIISSTNTVVWFKKRQKFKRGPQLPQFLQFTNINKWVKFCMLGINSTHLMVFGFQKIKRDSPSSKRNKVALVDFYNGIWTDWTPIPHQFIQNCHASLTFNKNNNAKIWLLAQKYVENINDIEIELMSMDLDKNDFWKTFIAYQLGSRILSEI